MARKGADKLSDELKVIAVTQELHDTVEANPNIKEVYFDENGDHHFRKFTADDKKDYARLTEQLSQLVNANGVQLKKSITGVAGLQIKDIKTREEVLALPIEN